MFQPDDEVTQMIQNQVYLGNQSHFAFFPTVFEAHNRSFEFDGIHNRFMDERDNVIERVENGDELGAIVVMFTSDNNALQFVNIAQ
jgi:hypothetical protein